MSATPNSRVATAPRRDGPEGHDVARREEPVGPRERPRRRGIGWVLGPALTAVLSTLAMAQALRLWEWRPGTPLEFDGDGAFVLMQVKDILDHGWYWTNPDVGAPFGQNSGWFSDASWTHYAAIRLLGVFSNDPITVGAAYFFVCFPLAALTMYFLARRLGVSVSAAVVIGVLFSVLPRHQEMFAHLWLSGYWVLPIALWLVLLALNRLPARPTTHSNAGPQLTSARRIGSLAGVGVALVVVGLGGVYYVAFSVALLAVGTAATVLATHDRAQLRRSVAFAAALGIVCSIPLVAAIALTRSDVVTGETPGMRGFWQSETFASKIMDLVLPWVHHRLAGAAALTANYDSATVPSPEQPALGVVALAGVVGLVLVGLAYMVGRPRGPQAPLLSTLALLLVTAVAFYTRGGLGALAAIVVTPQIRTWSRLVLVIALLGLLTVGFLISRVEGRSGRAVGGVLSGLVLVLGVLDQTNPSQAPAYGSLAAKEREVRAYVEVLESRLPPDCAVFQLPVMPFPENAPVVGMKDYDQLHSYIVSRDLRWSYGAMRGTAAGDWQLTLPAVNAPASLAADLGSAGFCAVEIDRAGLTNPDSVVAGFTNLLGTPVSTSADGRLLAFDLRPLRASMTSSSGVASVEGRGAAVLHRLPSGP